MRYSIHTINMKIYLIRHGQTTGDVENRYGGAYGWDDLSDTGNEQAMKLATELSGSGIEVIFSSPMKRAQQTAKVLSNELNCQIVTISDLRERNKNGILTGMTKDEALEKYPELVDKLKDYRSQIDGAESQDDFALRIKKSFLEIVNHSEYETVAIVTHGMPFWVIFGDLLNDHGIASVGDCGYAVLNKNGKSLSLVKLSDIEHNLI